MDACEIDDIHAVDGGEFGIVVAFEYLLCERDHFLDWDIEAIADAFEENVGDVKVHHQYVPI